MTPSEQRIGIFTTDTTLTIRSWDSWLELVSNIPSEAVYQRPLQEVIPQLKERGLLQRFQHVVEEGVVEVLAPAFHQFLIACPPLQASRHFKYMQQWVTIAPLHENGRIVGTLVTIEDVTARMDYERDLAEQLASPDEEIRRAASEQLMHMPSAAHSLVKVVDDSSWQVRKYAVSGLARHGGPEAIAALLEALRHEHHDPSVLNSALRVLALTEEDTTPALIACLRAEDNELRSYAALALGERHDSSAAPALIEAIGDSDPNVQYHAIEALGKLKAEAAIDALLDVAKSGDFFLAFPAIDALAQIGNPRAARPLETLLDDSFLNGAVIEALGKLGDQNSIAPLVKQLNQADANLAALVQALATIYKRYQDEYNEGGHIADLVRSSIDAVGTNNVLEGLQAIEPSALRALVLVLGWLDGPAVHASLARLLGQASVRNVAIEALVRYGAQVTTLLIDQLQNDDLAVRHAAIIALGRIGDAAAVPALIERLADEDELVVSAATVLGAIGDRRAFGALLELLGHDSPSVRQAAVGALNSLGHPELSKEVLVRLNDPDPHVRESAVQIAGYFGYPECIDKLIERCHDSDERVRRAAIEHLPYLDDERCLPILAEALLKDSQSVRAAAARAFSALEQEALPYLQTALHDTDAWVRYYAIRSIKQRREQAAQAQVAQLARNDPSALVRIAAIETLGDIGDEQAIEVLQSALQGDDDDMARVAIAALGQIKHPNAVQPLLATLDATASLRRADALQALGKRSEEGISSSLVRFIERENEALVLSSAISALGQIGDQTAIEALLAFSLKADYRELSITTLSQLPLESQTWIEQGLRHPDPIVRRNVVEALARSKRPNVSEQLCAALSDNDSSVRLAIVTALSHLGNQSAIQQLASLARSDNDPTVRQAAQLALQH